MQIVNIHAAKTHLSRLLEQAAAGEEIIIAKAGKPIAKLGPLMAKTSRKKRRLGLLVGRRQRGAIEAGQFAEEFVAHRGDPGAVLRADIIRPNRLVAVIVVAGNRRIDGIEREVILVVVLQRGPEARGGGSIGRAENVAKGLNQSKK